MKLICTSFALHCAAGAALANPSALSKEQQALFFGHDDRTMISAPYAAPYNAIGRLEVKSGGTCTATLIAPDVAITAAHCFLMQPRQIDAGRWFMAGFHNGQYQARYQVVGQLFHPRFRQGLTYKGDDVYIAPSAAPYDIALIKLKLKDGTPPSPMQLFQGKRQQLMRSILQQNQQVNQGGFAEDHDTQLSVHRGCQLTQLRSNGTIFHRCDTLSGDSGSPIWLDLPSGPTLIAVQSSAPDWFNRALADNVGVTVLQLPAKAQRWLAH